MLSRAEQDMLTQVGQGTPCGEWLRAFWFPIAVSDRWEGPGGQLEIDEPVTFLGRTGTATSFGREFGTFGGRPMPVRVLGEDLVLYRDRTGTLGLIDIVCPHRSSSMKYGRPRETGISCAYHGWTYDQTGRCLAMPGEPRDSNFRDKVRIKAYPVAERGGLIWAWLGRGAAPPIPALDVIAREDGVRVVENFCLWPANWLQIVENSVDQVHTGILHGEDSARADVWSRIPEVDWAPDATGIQTIQARGNYRRTNYLRLPTTILLTQPWPGGKFDWPRYSAIFRTPVDDDNTLLFHVTFVPDIDGTRPALPPGMEFPVHRLVQTLFLQDYQAIVSQGRPVDRTIERLGTTDRGVILLRRMVLDGIAAVQTGRAPAGVVPSSEAGEIIESRTWVADGLMRPVAAEYRVAGRPDSVAAGRATKTAARAAPGGHRTAG
ncbi:MAG TPA: aromatic ring-hydroxylating dioxygenase subunit alpha [Alphaproteobacteria bacterium]